MNRNFSVPRSTSASLYKERALSILQEDPKRWVLLNELYAKCVPDGTISPAAFSDSLRVLCTDQQSILVRESARRDHRGKRGQYEYRLSTEEARANLEASRASAVGATKTVDVHSVRNTVPWDLLNSTQTLLISHWQGTHHHAQNRAQKDTRPLT